jgi:hypothetical protein
MIHGIDITLITKTQTGTDAFNRPIYTVKEEIISDVLVGEPSLDEITSTLSLYGKQVKYTLAIPKGDTHTWIDTQVILPEPFEGKYRTIGYPTAGIDANIPLRWNKKVMIERYG